MKNRPTALIVLVLLSNLALGMCHYDRVSALNFVAVGMCAALLFEDLLEG